MDVVPSPKFQLDDAMLTSESVLVLVNDHGRALQLEVKFAVGGLLVGVLVGVSHF